MRIAVAGGTGLIGSRLVPRLRSGGHEVRVLARSAGVDLRSGEGVEEAVAGCDVVVDVLSTPAVTTRAAAEFFTRTTATLLSAGRRAGVSHHVVLSIVGVDRATSGHHGAKRAQEAALTAGEVPWSLLRATQFHEFAGQLLARTRVGRLAVVPRMRVAPVAADAVADALAELAVGGPVGRAPDLAGPAEEQLVAMARAVAPRLGVRHVLGLRVPGAEGRRLRDGGLLPGPGATRVGPTFAEWLASPETSGVAGDEDGPGDGVGG